MIKPIKIATALNYTKDVYVDCDKCGFKTTVHFDNDIVNLDNEENILDEYKIPECPKCKASLFDK